MLLYFYGVAYTIYQRGQDHSVVLNTRLYPAGRTPALALLDPSGSVDLLSGVSPSLSGT